MNPKFYPAFLLRLQRCQQGVVAIEAAIILPVMIFFMFATVEIYQYFRASAILNRASYSLADSLSVQTRLHDAGQCQNTDDICTYGVIVKDIMKPLDYVNGGHLNIYLLAAENSQAPNWKETAEWGKDCTGNGNCRPVTQLSPAAQKAIETLTPSSAKDTLLVVTVQQDYEPFAISGSFWKRLGGTTTLSSTTVYRPRFNDLRELQP